MDVLHLSSPSHQSNTHLRGQVPGAPRHSHQAAVQYGGSVLPCGNRIGRRHSQIIMTVERNRYRHGPAQLFRVCRHLIGKHGSGRIHNGKLVKPCRLQLFSFLSQFIRCQDVCLHRRVESFHFPFFNIPDRFHGYLPVSGVGAHPKERQAVFCRQINIFLPVALRVQEHAEHGRTV